MATPLFSIGGIASGLDTTAIIQQLISIERQPVVRFQQRQAQLRSVDDAWGKVVAKLSAMRTALDGVRNASDWSSFTSATSSVPDAVSITASGTVAPGSTTIGVTALAAAHQVVLDTTYPSAGTALAAGTVTVGDGQGGTLASFTTDGTTTLSDLAAQIDAAGIGVDASVIKTSDSGYQLVLASTLTGDESVFTVDAGTTGLGGSTVTTTGQDAVLTMGGLTITRSSNTITDLVEGATIELKQVTTSPVTLTTARDDEKAIAAVKSLVDAANAVLQELQTQTKYDADSGRAGALQGDGLARQLTTELRSVLSGSVGSGSVTHGSQLGISLTRGGLVTLDEATLKTALADDPSGVAAFFGESVSGMAGVSLAGSTSSTVEGDYTIQIDNAATIAMVTGATYSPPAGDPKVYTITSGDTTVQVTIAAGASIAQARTAIAGALARAGIETLSVTEDGTKLTISETRTGAHAFTVAADDGIDTLGLAGTHAGQAVSGSISTATATGGSGNVLTAVGGDATGLALRYTGSGAASGTVSFSTGFGGLLDRYLSAAEGSDGSIQRARDTLDGRIRDYDDQIAAFEVRLELRETALRRQFASLESSMGQLQAQGNWLASQIGSMTPTG